MNESEKPIHGIPELHESKSGPEACRDGHTEKRTRTCEPFPLLTHLETGSHFCCLYERREDCKVLLEAFFRQGLERGEKALYLADAGSTVAVRDFMRNAGLEVESLVEMGQLCFLCVDDAFLKAGVFDPVQMMAILRSETEQARADGYTTLRLAGDMTWIRQATSGSDRLIEYEARIGEFLTENDCTGLCLYDRRRFKADLLLHILAAHPTLYVSGELHDNLYFIPPGEIQRRDLPSKALDYWLMNLAEYSRSKKALRESEEKFRNLAEQSPNMIWINQKRRIVYVNERCVEVMGYTREEYYASDFKYLDLISPEYVDMQKENFKKHMRGEEILPYEYAVVTKDGRRLEALLSTKLITYEGEPAILGTVTDITEQRKAAEKLKEIEGRYRALFERSLLLVYVHDLTGRFLDANQAALDALGYAREEIHTVDFSALLDEEQLARAVERTKELITVGYQEKPIEYKLQTKSGDLIWVETEATLLYRGGKPFAIQGIARDITERKRADGLFSAQRELGKALSGVTRLDDGLRLCLESAFRVSGMDGGGIYLIDETSGSLDLAFHQNLSPDFAREVAHYEADSPNARLVLAGTPLYERYPDLDLPAEELKKGEGLRAIAVIPIWHEDRVIGSMILTSLSADVVPVLSRIALETIAAHMGGAIARLKTEEALRESEAKYRALAENVPDVIYSLDKEAKVIAVNEPGLALFGYSRDRVLGEHFASFIHPDDANRVVQSFLEAVQTRREFTRGLEFRIVRKDGQIRWVELNSHMRFDGHGNYFQEEGVLRDITARKAAEEALKEAERRYRAFFDCSLSMVYIHDFEGRMLDANQTALKVLGYTREDIPRINFSTLLDEEQLPMALQATEEVLAKGHQEKPLEFKVRRKDGRCVWADIEGSLLYREGRPFAILGMARDITERKKAEEALRKSEERFRGMAERSVDTVFECDAEGRLLYISPGVGRITGHRPEEALGESVFSFLPVSDLKKGAEAFQSLLDHGIMTGFQAEVVRKDGSPAFVEVNASAIRKDGRIMGIQGIVRDITDRKRAEDALQESETFLQNAFDAIQEGICVLDRDLRILRVNSWLEMMYASEMPLVGKKCYAVYQKRETPCPRCPTLRTLENGRAYIETVAYPSEENPTGWMEVSAFPLRDYKGNLLGAIEYLRDISERKQAEQEIQRSREQLRALAARLQVIREEERADIAREVHDELGHELTSLKMDLMWLGEKMGEGNHGVRRKGLGERVERMRQSLDRTMHRVRRISTELRPGILDHLGLDAAIEWQSQEFQERTGILCELTLPRCPVTLAKDPATGVFRIFQEILTNAVRHAEATRVEVRLEEHEGDFTLTVQDDGRGIKEDEIEGPRSLGILGMRERARMLGGEITFHGDPGKGTTVAIRIPVQESRRQAQ
jgi:PAS domain S-box-containing protein